MLSSLAGIIGSISQANYAAGNTFQDALVHYRHAQGLSAQSIDLGLIRGLGYVEEHEEVAARTSSLKFVCFQVQVPYFCQRNYFLTKIFRPVSMRMNFTTYSGPH